MGWLEAKETHHGRREVAGSGLDGRFSMEKGCLMMALDILMGVNVESE